MSGKTVLISGGGIAGPAVAYWLQRFGFVPTVVERAAAPRPGGHAVDLRGASPGVVERMGLLDEVRGRSLHERGMAFVDADGRHRAEIPVEAFGGRGGVAEIEILRGDLAEVLVDATGDGVEYRYGDHITALDQDADGVRARFASAVEERYDLVIGADGAHSRVRALAFGPEERFAHPLGACTAHYTIPAERAVADGLDLGEWFSVHSAPGRRMVATRPDRDGGIKAMFMIGSSGADDALLRDPVAQRALLRERFADVGWQARAMLAAMDGADDFYFDSYAQVRMPTWSNGRVVLLGDAAYCPSPITGQGTNLALVGAYVLAGELALAGDDVAAGAAAYERALREYVQRNHKLPPGGLSAMLPGSRFAIRMGYAFNRLMTSRFVEPLATRLMLGDDDGFTPRDYPADLASPTRCA
ncbi:FAD-dependent monooxygenase [Pseudonocardia humida]|uniref:FAD-dependent monooxygenase n=1 Tax=Pseudonocardia humida TaxID=2800819 RepID=A0ABT0ZWZ8_9PSEU|nr:FAD-dependent monooxygenase [Pseudonocardia humida]MCO1655251.1 FAD-dependent monooxygenase [Pseudonocardia humida]